MRVQMSFANIGITINLQYILLNILQSSCTKDSYLISTLTKDYPLNIITVIVTYQAFAKVIKTM